MTLQLPNITAGFANYSVNARSHSQLHAYNAVGQHVWQSSIYSNTL